MSETLALVVFGPPAIFGVMMLIDGWVQRRHERRMARHRGLDPDCPVCREYARARGDHPSGHVGPAREWL